MNHFARTPAYALAHLLQVLDEFHYSFGAGLSAVKAEGEPALHECTLFWVTQVVPLMVEYQALVSGQPSPTPTGERHDHAIHRSAV